MDLIEITAAAGTAEAVVARPDNGGADHPGVLFFMDAIGVRPQVAAMCERIASWGYVVLAPNVFYRDSDVDAVRPHADLRVAGAREAFFAEAMPRVGGLTSDLAEPDIAAYLTALRGLQGVAPGPVGVVGYCMGRASRCVLRPDTRTTSRHAAASTAAAW